MEPKPDQKIEISHDILARKVYARIGVEEKMRLKMLQFVRDRYAYYRDSEVLLGEKELNYLAPYLDRMELDEEQKLFIRKSRSAAKKTSQRKRWALLGLIGVLSIFLLIAVSLWRSSEMSRREATLSEMRTQEANRALQEQQAIAIEARDLANLNALRADTLARQSERAAKLARTQEAMALQQKAKAEIAEQNTRQALTELERSNMLGVELLLGEATNDILELRYDEATQKIKAAAALKALPDQVTSIKLELAFWYTETGQIDKALPLVDGMADLSGSLDTQDLSQQRKWLRDHIRSYSTPLYDSLEQRYFPQLIAVKSGHFQMGCDQSDDPGCKPDEQPAHTVELTDYLIGRTEVTFWQFGLFCAATGRSVDDHVPSWGMAGDNPAVNISWLDALTYANWLSEHLDLTPVYQLKDVADAYGTQADASIKWDEVANWQANGFRLPTEAEWEYAAGGGAGNESTIAIDSTCLNLVAWYSANSGYSGAARSQRVGTKKANALGLFDVRGNADEWCWDWYDASYYQNSPTVAPRGPDTGSMHVLRGGSWYSYDYNCRITSRHISGQANVRYDYNGFRLVRSN